MLSLTRTVTAFVAAVPIVLVSACSTASQKPVAPAPAVAHSPAPLIISVASTNDLHGHIEALPRLGGFVANLRRARAADGGGVLLLDGGDTFQGELASNISEGATVVDAYNALGYDAAAVGNHEFDFGPVGPRSAPGPGDDPRGALIARAAQARYPLLAANLVDQATNRPFSPPNVVPSTIVTVQGVKVGLVGLLTLETTVSVLASVFAGLRLDPLDVALAREAKSLRDRGATVIIGVAHAGGGCKEFANPDDLSSCYKDTEIFRVAGALPAGTVDAIVAGHTHARLAHRVNGIPIIEAGANGEALARVDLVVDRQTGKVTASRLHPPVDICTRTDPTASCAPAVYEGAPVIEDTRVAAVVSMAQDAAAKLRNKELGVTVSSALRRSREGVESSLSNLVADLMRKARPKAHVTLMHSGGLRADLGPGPVRYGNFYEVYPRDSTFATATMTGAALAALLEGAYTDPDGRFVSVSGARVKTRCDGGRISVTLQRDNGKPIGPSETLVVTTNNLLATGAKGPLGGQSWQVEDDPPVREELVRVLTERGGTLSQDDKTLLDPANPRVALPHPVPVRCETASK